MELKDRIIARADELFSQYGIKNVSMDELAQSLGISKRTIYENFKDKEDILLCTREVSERETKMVLEEIIQNSENVIEVFLKFFHYKMQKPFPVSRYFQDIRKYYPRIFEQEQQLHRQMDALFPDFIRKGIEQGVIRPNLNVDVVIFLLKETVIANAISWNIQNPPFPFREIVSVMVLNFMRGISTPKGIQIVDEYLEREKRN